MKVRPVSLFRTMSIILIIIMFSGNNIAQTGSSINQEAFSVQTRIPATTTSPIMGTNDYYLSTYKLYGTDLRLALHNIIKNHTVISYASLWTYFQTTDKKANGKVWDMYSDIPDGTPPYQFTFISNQCGNYAVEGDCYNREHSWPQSWFNSATTPSSDIFHIYPTDGKVNGQRSNYPYGNVSNPTWTSLNGSKLGTNTFPGYSGIAFEPIDAYKGDLARSSMYMSVRYYLEDSGWATKEGTNKSDLLPWYANLLYDWSVRDTVSQKEIDRNNAIYAIQKNRNPFIDHPEFAAEIWETTMAPSVVSVNELNSTSILIDFSRYLDSTVTVNTQNFIFDNAIGNPTGVEWGVNSDVSKIVIKVPALATGTTYSIQLKNLKSINDITMDDTVITFKTSGATGINEKQDIPQRFVLQQNYPNPFNPSTVINWQLSRKLSGSHVTLKVFDVLGNEVAELVNNWLEAGTYKVTFNATSLSSGIYFYKLSAGNKSAMKKLILMR